MLNITDSGSVTRNNYGPNNRLKNRLKQFNVAQLKIGYSTSFGPVFNNPCDRGECLPSDILYTNVLASETWSTQAHEQVMTTVTSHRNEMSTTLPLLDYRDVSNKLIFFKNNEPRNGVTHVAVLNHTLNKYMEGALCLLLRRIRHLDVFRRLNFSPAVLPNLGKFTSRLQKTKILICPGPSNSSQNNRVDTTFSIGGDSFLVQAWNAKGGIHNSILPLQGRSDKEFEIQTYQSENSNRPAQISCRIADCQNPTLEISLKLIKIGDT